MANPKINEYLSRIGIRKYSGLDTALISEFGPGEGNRHIENLTQLFDQSEERLFSGTGSPSRLFRQEELVDYLNQDLKLSILASSFYDRIFFRRAMEYILEYGSLLGGDILDIGCGNGILTCFLATERPDSPVTGTDLSANALLTAGKLAERLQLKNALFQKPRILQGNVYDAVFSCRTVHENVAWRPLCENMGRPALPLDELTKRHQNYACELAGLIKPEGYLLSIERYEDDDAYAAFIRALGRAGLRQKSGAHIGFSCKNGDETGVFQANVFQKK